MGSLHDAVMQYVEQEMKKDPGVKNATLFAGAREIDESIGELRPQQFHAVVVPVFWTSGRLKHQAALLLNFSRARAGVMYPCRWRSQPLL